MQLSVYLSIYPSVRPAVRLSIHLHHHLSIACSVSQRQLPAPWSQSPQAYAVCTLTAFLLPWSAWLAPLHDSLPPWAVLSLRGTIALLPQAALLFRAKTDIREWGELHSVFPRQNAYYGKWIVNLFPIHVFLSRFSMDVIRCIQLLFSFCPFIIMHPPILRKNMFPPHSSLFFKIANKAAARYTVMHMLTPSLRISIIILSVKNFFAWCSIFFFFF